MGFWKALDEVFPSTRHQRCRVHKTANVLNKFPKSMQPTVKADLREIWHAESRARAKAVMDIFAEKYAARYEKAVTCLTKDRDAKLMVFKLVQTAAKTWRRLKRANQLPMIIEGVTFTDGVAANNTENRAA